MSKLKLEIDSLCVESFETAAAHGEARGTVRGAQRAGIRDDELDNTQPVTSDDPSFVQTCWFYTCAGCTTADPAYCPPTSQA